MKGIVYMTGGQLSLALTTLNWDVDTAVRYLGQDRRRILQWLHDQHDIPKWVAIYLGVLVAVPDARPMAHKIEQHLAHQQHEQVRAREAARTC